MAKKMDSDPFGPFSNGFDFDQAFNGDTWKLTQGQDFTLSPGTVVKKIHDEYERRYGGIDVKAEGKDVFIRVFGHR